MFWSSFNSIADLLMLKCPLDIEYISFNSIADLQRTQKHTTTHNTDQKAFNSIADLLKMTERAIEFWGGYAFNSIADLQK